MTPIFQALACHAQDRPDAIAFRDGERSMTWADLARAVSRAAAGFAAGPRCVGLALGGLYYVIGDLAATLSGCRVVPVPGFFSAGQVAHLLADSGGTLIDRLPAGASLMYIGDHDLGEMPWHERPFQLRHAGVRDQFRSVRASDDTVAQHHLN